MDVYSRSTGLLSGVFDGHAEKEVQIMQQWGYYTSYASDKEGDQNSGAYIFRPEQPNETLREINDQCESVEIFVTELLTEVHTIYSSWIKQVIRVKSDTAYLEVEYSVGPIPDHDGKGKEVVTRFDTSINSGNIFYTDSNGRDFIKRTRSYRRTWDLVEHQPVSGNYYPVNAAIFIQDDASSVSILNDRSQGGTSLTEGSLELMIHRRTKADDVRGVGEPLDETDGGMTPYPPYGNQARLGKGVVITGSYRIYLTSEPNGASIARTGMDQMFSPVHIFLGSTQKLDDPPFQHESFSALSSQLPANIMLVTFAKIHARPGTYMVRLAHQYGIGEGPLAAPVDVDISNLFNDTRKIISITEKTLSGNQDWSEWSIKKLKWESFLQQASSRSVSAGCMFSNVNTVTISPMKICTMEVKTVIDLKVNSKI